MGKRLSSSSCSEDGKRNDPSCYDWIVLARCFSILGSVSLSSWYPPLETVADEARSELLEGALGSTLIAFQTQEYARHFVQTCSRILSVEAVDHGCMLDDRLIRIRCSPIGIDLAYLQKQINDPQVVTACNFLKEKYSDKRLLVSRDKFDHIRGLKPKMLAYERFLSDHPEWLGKVHPSHFETNIRLYSFKLRC